MQLSNHRWLRRSWRFFILVSVLLAGIMLAVRPVSSYPQGIKPVAGAVPLFYIANHGQMAPSVRYMVKTPELTAYFESNSIQFTGRGENLRLEFLGANSSPAVEGIKPLSAKANFFAGNQPSQWHVNVPLFGAVYYSQLYPGIDMIYGESDRNIKSDFIVAPGAAPSSIRFRYAGAKHVSVASDGGLVVVTNSGQLREHPPVLYQQRAARRIPVKGSFLVSHDQVVSFEVGDYDTSIPLWIDPVVSYSTYVGGSRVDNATAIQADGSGNVFLAGWTDSTNFPTAVPVRGPAGSVDAFIMKFNSTGTSLAYATYIGGNADDRAYGIDIDPSGNAYLVGYTNSLNFPIVSAAQKVIGGGRDAFCLKLNAAGSVIAYSTYFGGSGNDVANGVGVDSFGQPYVVGETDSTNFPTRFPYQAAKSGLRDAFSFKLSASGTTTFSTYIGGSGDDRGLAIAVSGTLTPYITGCTTSTNFPTKVPAQAANAGGMDAFVVRFNSDANNTVYSSYLGGTGGSNSAMECGYGIALDTFNNAYITGSTPSLNFPTLTPFQAAYAGGSLDAFVTKYNSSGQRLYSSYLGGMSLDVGTAIRVDANTRRAMIAGYTSSLNFPLVTPTQATFGGMYDGFFAKVDVNGNVLNSSSFWGGSGTDIILGIAYRPTGELFIAGATNSANYPLLAPYQSAPGGSNDAFLAKIGGVGP